MTSTTAAVLIATYHALCILAYVVCPPRLNDLWPICKNVSDVFSKRLIEIITWYVSRWVTVVTDFNQTLAMSPWHSGQSYQLPQFRRLLKAASQDQRGVTIVMQFLSLVAELALDPMSAKLCQGKLEHILSWPEMYMLQLLSGAGNGDWVGVRSAVDGVCGIRHLQHRRRIWKIMASCINSHWLIALACVLVGELDLKSIELC